MTGGDAEGLRRALAAAGQAWPAPIEHHPRLGSTNDLSKERASVLARLTVWYHALKEAGTSSLIGAWRARSGGQVIRGVARDVDEQGALVLDGKDGERRIVLSGDVQELRLAPVETCS